VLSAAAAARLHRVALVLLWFRLMAGMVCGRVANAPERGNSLNQLQTDQQHALREKLNARQRVIAWMLIGFTVVSALVGLVVSTLTVYGFFNE